MTPQTAGRPTAEVLQREVFQPMEHVGVVLQRMERVGATLAREGVAFEEVAVMAPQVRRGWSRWWLQVICAKSLRRRGQR